MLAKEDDVPTRLSRICVKPQVIGGGQTFSKKKDFPLKEAKTVYQSPNKALQGVLTKQAKLTRPTSDWSSFS